MMRFIIACCLLMTLCSCASVKTPYDYSRDGSSEEGARSRYQSRNDVMDMPDGGDTFKNRNMHIFGATY